jgi:uncharacterized alkaline shock family protein YloU
MATATPLTTTRPDAPVRVASAARPDVFNRGTTTIADGVVAKIASQAAIEVESASASRRTVLGVPRSLSRRRPAASVAVDGRLARIRLNVAIDYPAPIRAITRQVRTQVVEQVRSMTGIDVKEVDITVTALLQETSTPPRVQ